MLCGFAKIYYTLFFLSSLFYCNNFVNSAKILTVFPQASRSHYIALEGILIELVNRGHEITSINYYPQKKPVKNFRDIELHVPQSFYGEF